MQLAKKTNFSDTINQQPNFILVLCKDGQKPLFDIYKKFDAVKAYDGTDSGELFGWYISIKHKHNVEALCKEYNLEYIEVHLSDIDSLKKDAFKDTWRSYEHSSSNQIAKLAKNIGIDYSNIDDLLSPQLHHELSKTDSGKKLLQKAEFNKKARTMLKEIENKELIEKSNSTKQNSSSLNVQFISHMPVNYLIEEAPEAPALLKVVKGANSMLFLRRGIVGMLVGAGGIGKTHFLTQLALAIATGTPFLNRYIISKKGNVFIGLGENSEEDIHRLLRKMSKGAYSEDALKDASNRIAITSFSGKQSTFIHANKESEFYKELFQWLIDNEPQDGWSLIIFDPISRLMGADAENDSFAATCFISLLEKFTLELKGRPTVLLGHHMSKSGFGTANTDQTAARGSSAITDGVRWQANLDRVAKENGDEKSYEPDQVCFRVTKSNFTAISEKPHILIKDEWGRLKDKDTDSNCNKSPFA